MDANYTHISEAVKYIKKHLANTYHESEIQGILLHIGYHVFVYSPTQMQMNINQVVTGDQKAQINHIVDELQKNKPIQQILGHTEFYGLEFEVDRHVLIPRPETEELVDMVLKETKIEQPRVLDIGTGSGCMAVSLAKNLSGAKVTAIDVSKDALKIARKNARKNEVNVNFMQVDFLNRSEWKGLGSFDVIVSNPPYVEKSAITNMNKNVTDYEPHLALFVDDADPLIFYRRIKEFAAIKLKPHGRIYVEINEKFGTETLNELWGPNLNKVGLKNDINNKERFVVAIRDEYE